MRLLELVTTAGWGGAQHQVLALASWAAARGKDVHLAAGSDGELFARAARAGITVHPLRYLKPEVDPVADLRALLEISRLIGTLRPDVLHTHSSKAGVLGRLAAHWPRLRPSGPTPSSGYRRAAVVHHCHGLSFGPGRRAGPLGWTFLAAERLSGWACDGVISVSQGVEAEVRRHRLYPRARRAVVLNAVDVPELPIDPRRDVREELGIRADATVFSIVARLVDGKGHLVAIQACADLVAAGVDAYLLVVGAGPLEARIRAEWAGLPGLRDRVRMLGFRADVPRLLLASDALVLPSLAEGLSLVAIEAALAGIPVVATGIPGLNEVVQHLQTGLLVPYPPRREDLGAAMRRIAEDPVWARRLGQEARIAAKQRFSINNLERSFDFIGDIVQSMRGESDAQTKCQRPAGAGHRF